MVSGLTGAGIGRCGTPTPSDKGFFFDFLTPETQQPFKFNILGQNRSEIDGFGVQEGFQMVQEGRSSSLTKYEPVASHEDPIYSDFHGYGDALPIQLSQKE